MADNNNADRDENSGCGNEENPYGNDVLIHEDILHGLLKAIRYDIPNFDYDDCCGTAIVAPRHLRYLRDRINEIFRKHLPEDSQ